MTSEPDQLCEASMRFLTSILSRSKVDPAIYRLAPLQRRLPACLRALKASNVDSAQRVLKARPEMWQVAIDALLIGVTRFYRDRDVFDTLRREWLPRLLASKPALRVWSVGASDGAELYSVAALLAEAGALEGSELRGSDCRASAISTAQQARYHPAAFDDLPLDLREKYFRQESGTFAPAGPLRCARIDWKVENALESSEQGWDLILCRNLAIYLSYAMQTKLWNILNRALQPEGLLVVGKAERPAADGLRRLSACTYARDLI